MEEKGGKGWRTVEGGEGGGKEREGGRREEKGGEGR